MKWINSIFCLAIAAFSCLSLANTSAAELDAKEFFSYYEIGTPYFFVVKIYPKADSNDKDEIELFNLFNLRQSILYTSLNPSESYYYRLRKNVSININFQSNDFYIYNPNDQSTYVQKIPKKYWVTSIETYDENEHIYLFHFANTDAPYLVDLNKLTLTNLSKKDEKQKNTEDHLSNNEFEKTISTLKKNLHEGKINLNEYYQELFETLNQFFP